jgi:hypothetical protein
MFGHRGSAVVRAALTLTALVVLALTASKDAYASACTSGCWTRADSAGCYPISPSDKSSATVGPRGTGAAAFETGVGWIAANGGGQIASSSTSGVNLWCPFQETDHFNHTVAAYYYAEMDLSQNGGFEIEVCDAFSNGTGGICTGNGNNSGTGYVKFGAFAVPSSWSNPTFQYDYAFMYVFLGPSCNLNGYVFYN